MQQPKQSITAVINQRCSHVRGNPPARYTPNCGKQLVLMLFVVEVVVLFYRMRASINYAVIPTICKLHPPSITLEYVSVVHVLSMYCPEGQYLMQSI